MTTAVSPDPDRHLDVVRCAEQACQRRRAERRDRDHEEQHEQCLTEQEAYLSVGMLLRAQLCQVVNPRTSVAVSLEGGADRVLAVAPRR